MELLGGRRDISRFVFCALTRGNQTQTLKTQRYCQEAKEEMDFRGRATDQIAKLVGAMAAEAVLQQNRSVEILSKAFVWVHRLLKGPTLNPKPYTIAELSV